MESSAIPASVSTSSSDERKPQREIVVVGLNHETAPIQVRERLAFRTDALVATAQALKEQCSLAECAILSTCNRAEVYAVGDTIDPTSLLSLLSTLQSIDSQLLQSHSYSREGREAVRHLCRVSAGLDSMVLGESQILAQVKQAAEGAVEAQTSGPILAALFRQAVMAGKRSRTETEINRGAVSISHAAVELARQIFGDLAGCKALVLGAGE